MNKLPCEVVRDLFPSYVEKLTSEKTNACIEAHLESCEDCKAALRNLTGGELETLAPEERVEVDFLKKQKNRTKRIALLAVLGVVVLGVGALAAKLFWIGRSVDYYETACDLQVDGKEMKTTLQLFDSGSAIRKVAATQEKGDVTISATAALVGLWNSGSAQADFSFDDEIRTVRYGDRILWANGREISELASALYAARNRYVGDMPANDRLSQILKLRERFGEYENELSTDAEPYGWTFRLKTDFHEGTRRKDQLEADVLDCGALLLATVENLGWVRVEYTVDGEPTAWLLSAEPVTYEQQTSAKHCFTVSWAKSCWDDVSELDRHINQETELNVSKAPEEADALFGVDLLVDSTVTNEVVSVHASLNRGGKKVVTGFLTRAESGDAVQAGEDAVFLRLNAVQPGEEYRLVAKLIFPEGKTRTAEYTLPAPDAPGETVTLHLRKADGEYVIGP